MTLTKLILVTYTAFPVLVTYTAFPVLVTYTAFPVHRPFLFNNNQELPMVGLLDMMFLRSL